MHCPAVAAAGRAHERDGPGRAAVGVERGAAGGGFWPGRPPHLPQHAGDRHALRQPRRPRCRQVRLFWQGRRIIAPLFPVQAGVRGQPGRAQGNTRGGLHPYCEGGRASRAGGAPDLSAGLPSRHPPALAAEQHSQIQVQQLLSQILIFSCAATQYFNPLFFFFFFFFFL